MPDTLRVMVSLNLLDISKITLIQAGL